MTPEDLTRLFPALKEVESGALDLLLQTTTKICPDAGDTVISSGAPNDTMYFICAGSVRVSLDSSDECSILGDFGPGQWIGEMGMLQPAAAAASVVALDDCVLLSMSNEEFAGLRQSSPALTSVLLQMLCRDLSVRLHATIGFIDRKKTASEPGHAAISPKTLIDIAKNLLGIAARTGA